MDLDLINDKNIEESNTINGSKSIGKWVSVIYRKFQMDINKELKKYELASSQYIFLVQLYQNDGVSQDYLSKLLHIDKSSAARAIKFLENNNFVIRKVNSNDKRSYNIYLTEKSFDIKDDLFDILEEWNRKLTQSLSDDDYQVAYRLLSQMSIDILA